MKNLSIKALNIETWQDFDGDICVAWCQFGPPQELPNINHKKEVESKMTMPDWRNCPARRQLQLALGARL